MPRIIDDPTFEPAVRQIVRDETAGLKSDVKTTAVLLEDLHGKVDNLAQLVSESLGQTRLWRENEHRLHSLEKTQQDIINTAAKHSRKLAA